MSFSSHQTVLLAIGSCWQLCIAVALIGLFYPFVGGQAYGQFATVINVPPSPGPDYVGSNTKVNILTGGELGAFAQSGVLNGSTKNIEINVLGGFIGREFRANSGTVLNVSAGTVGEN